MPVAFRGLALWPLLLAWLSVVTSCGGGSSSSVNTDQGSQVSQPGAFQFENVSYPNVVFVPSSYDGSRALPAILLVHGGGGKGQDMIDLWQQFAQKQGIILVAPTLPLDAQFETKVPRLFPALMDSIKAKWKIDPSRIYVFGYSAGGYSTFDAATLASTYFAAVGVFASIITPDYYGIIQQAKRKTPIAMYIGDHDQFFTVAQAAATRDQLVANGFTVHFVVLPDQDHNYAAVSNFVNSDVWTFFSQYMLPQ